MSPIQLETRIQELIEGILPEERWPELREELNRSEEARELYCTYVRMHALLDRRVKGLKAILAHTPVLPIEDLLEDRRKKSINYAVLASAAVLLATAIVMRMVFLAPEPPVLSFQASSGSEFILTDASGGRVSGDQVLEEGSRLVLSQGVVELNFGSGVRSVVRGPADFTLHEKDRLYFREGIGWFQVPQKAVGFRVVTRELQVTDLGTEFGVISLPHEADEVHVFTGRVEIKTLAGVKAQEVLSAGNARSAGVVGHLSKIDPQPELFLKSLPVTLPHLWVDWTSVSAYDTTGATITGSVGGVTVTATLGGATEFNPDTVLDGTSTTFSSADYTPFAVTTDEILQRFYHTGDTITFTFSSPVVNPRIHLNRVQALVNPSSPPQDVMSYSATPTKLSGTADWSISGNNHQWTSGTRTAELDGTVEFDGTYSSITVTQLLDLGTAWDTHGIQVTVESAASTP